VGAYDPLQLAGIILPETPSSESPGWAARGISTA
jgi:hypothetical protein